MGNALGLKFHKIHIYRLLRLWPRLEAYINYGGGQPEQKNAVHVDFRTNNFPLVRAESEPGFTLGRQRVGV
jgi:hypothetical protein